jgi:hypothetical protein
MFLRLFYFFANCSYVFVVATKHESDENIFSCNAVFLDVMFPKWVIALKKHKNEMHFI